MKFKKPKSLKEIREAEYIYIDGVKTKLFGFFTFGAGDTIFAYINGSGMVNRIFRNMNGIYYIQKEAELDKGTDYREITKEIFLEDAQLEINWELVHPNYNRCVYHKTDPRYVEFNSDSGYVAKRVFDSSITPLDMYVKYMPEHIEDMVWTERPNVKD